MDTKNHWPEARIASPRKAERRWNQACRVERCRRTQTARPDRNSWRSVEMHPASRFTSNDQLSTTLSVVSNYRLVKITLSSQENFCRILDVSPTVTSQRSKFEHELNAWRSDSKIRLPSVQFVCRPCGARSTVGSFRQSSFSLDGKWRRYLVRYSLSESTWCGGGIWRAFSRHEAQWLYYSGPPRTPCSVMDSSLLLQTNLRPAAFLQVVRFGPTNTNAICVAFQRASSVFDSPQACSAIAGWLHRVNQAKNSHSQPPCFWPTTESLMDGRRNERRQQADPRAGIYTAGVPL